MPPPSSTPPPRRYAGSRLHVSPSPPPAGHDEDVIEAVIVDPRRPLERAEPCSDCGYPDEGAAKFCPSCGVPRRTAETAVTVQGRSGASLSALPQRTFHCENCGSDVATSLDQRSYQCPFCGSAYVKELPIGEGSRQRPEFIIGFAVTAEQAREKFFAWLGQNSWFRPGDLAARSAAEKQRGVYLPFWHFSMLAHSSWQARIGQYWYRTETYTVRDANGKTQVRTRQVRETEWWPLSGRHHRYYYGYLVPATQSIAPQEAAQLQPFQLQRLVRFRPHFLAGWMAEEYHLSPADAAAHTEQVFRQRQEAEVRRFLPGDTHADLRVSTVLTSSGSDLILLPVHVLSYRYRDRVYRFLVNGQTGKVTGDKPVSAARISAAVITACILLALVVLAFWLLSR
jgi:predicted RNA-binding Zn-ribbon protein involved in translation (DUF1610 family)